MVADQPLYPLNLSTSEALTPLEPDRFQPELRTGFPRARCAHGAARAGPPSKRKDDMVLFEELLATIPVYRANSKGTLERVCATQK
jgi:hypothetical protein